MAQTKSEIRAILETAGLHPRKRYGQNFLIDKNLLAKFVDALALRPDDTVLEVGPGTGVLTEALLTRAGRVVAVEIDHDLAAVLAKLFADANNLTLLRTDILETKSSINPEVLRLLDESRQALGGRVLLAANLPYQVATPLLANLLLTVDYMSPFCFTVQAEVGERFQGQAGTKAYGPISIFAQVLCTIQRIARVPPPSFWPVPKIDSVMLRLDRRDPPQATPEELACLHRLVHATFIHRRKTIQFSLKRILPPEVFADLQASGICPLDQRCEQLSPEQWLALAQWWKQHPGENNTQPD